METKRRWLSCFVLSLSLPCLAAASEGYQDWLEFKEEFAALAGGPTGYYSIQDMQELNPGDTAYLAPSKDLEQVRWTAQPVKRFLARLEYKNHKAIIGGPGIPDTDVLQAKELQIQYQKSWDDIEALLILLKDRTSGKTTYAGGRVVEVPFPKGTPPNQMTIDLNRAYSFLCAHSSFYNCPIVLTNYVDAALNYGEKYPPLLSKK
jgi:hypothetical protein